MDSEPASAMTSILSPTPMAPPSSPPPSAKEPDLRVLLLGMVLLWPTAAALPTLLGVTPFLALPWTVAVGAAYMRWALYATPRARRAARRARFRVAPLGRTTLWVVLAAGAAVVLTESFYLAFARVVPEPPTEPDAVAAYARRSALHALTVIVSGVCVAPLMEELAMRGLVMGALERRYGAAPAIGLSALLFAVLHTSWHVMPTLFVAGVVLGVVAWAAGSVWASLIAHVAWNAFSLAERLWTGGEAPELAALSTGALAALFAAALLAWLLLVRQVRALSRDPRDRTPAGGLA